MNYARDVVDAAPRSGRALVALDETGGRRELTFGEVAERSARIAGALAERGVARGDVVMTVVGSTARMGARHDRVLSHRRGRAALYRAVARR